MVGGGKGEWETRPSVDMQSYLPHGKRQVSQFEYQYQSHTSFFSQIGLAEYLAFNVMRKKQREASTNMLGIVELGKTIFAGSYS